MTKKRITLADEMLVVKVENTRRYGHDNAEIDQLGSRIKKLYHERKTKTQTDEFRLDVKMALLSMVRQLSKTSPHFLHQGGRTADLTEALPGMEAHNNTHQLEHALDALDEIQTGARFTTKPEEKARYAQGSQSQVNLLIDLVERQRNSVIEPRPRLKQNHYRHPEPYVFWAIEPSLYSAFVRNFVASAMVDRKENPAVFEKLPNLDALTREARGFMALLDFAETVNEVLRLCEHDTSSPQKYWKQNQAVLKKQLVEAVDKFNDTIRPLHIKMSATSPAYQACVRAEERILNATTYDGAFEAYKALKHHGFLFVLGGEDKIRDIYHHKLITRIGEAYRQDRKLIKEGERDYEHQYNVDHHPYNNPLHQAGHTFNRIYEARWCLAADALQEGLESYAATIADPQIAPPSQQPPQDAPIPHIMSKTKAVRLRDKAAAAPGDGKPRAAAGDTYTVQHMKNGLTPHNTPSGNTRS